MKKIIILLLIVGCLVVVYFKRDLFMVGSNHPLVLENEKHKKDKKEKNDKEKMEICIRKTLHLRDNESFTKKLKIITKFECNDYNLKTLPYLNEMINLTNLNLGYNKISTLKDIVKLNKLKRLDLGINDLANIKGINHLNNLEFLDIGGNHIKDISPLKNNKTIVELITSDNPIKNKKIYKTMRNYQKLDSNQIEYDIIK